MSSKLATIAATFVASALLATSANALTIVNKDKTNHDVRILVTGVKKEQKVKVAAGASVDFDCSKGCVAHIGKKDKGAKDTTIKGPEKTLTIMDNKLTAQ